MDIPVQNIFEEYLHRLVQICLISDIVISIQFSIYLVCIQPLGDVGALPLGPKQIHLLEGPGDFVYLIYSCHPGATFQDLAHNRVVVAGRTCVEFETQLKVCLAVLDISQLFFD